MICDSFSFSYICVMFLMDTSPFFIFPGSSPATGGAGSESGVEDLELIVTEFLFAAPSRGAH